MYYKKRWCSLSLKVVLVSLALTIVFGDWISNHIKINLVLLLVLIQVGYLGVLTYLDGYYDTRNLLDKWKKMQNA